MDTPAARLPLRTVIASITGVWVCYFVLATLRGLVVGLDLNPEILARRLGVTLAAMAITLLLWGLLRMIERRPLWVQATTMLVAALPASLAVATINQAVFAPVEKDVVKSIGEKTGVKLRKDEAGNILLDVPGTQGGVTVPSNLGGETRLQQITDLALGRYFVLIAWVTLYLALGNAAQARVAERREGEYRRAAKAAELRSLRYQVNPHFLFNTLNSLSALVMTGKGEAAEQMIQTLSRFYRSSLSEDPTADHTLSEEIALQQHYLEIEAVRFPERLRVAIDVPDDLALAMVPGMILQPLVENSVKYGVAATSRPVTITIAARNLMGALEVSVSDDGPGIGAAKGGFGIGLTNVLDRLRARFGESAELATLHLPKGHMSTIRMPLELDHD